MTSPPRTVRSAASRRRIAAVLPATCLAAAAAGLAGADTHRWWSPTASPVNGAFSATPNWAGFDRPSTTPGAEHRLEFIFANGADFTATNDLQSGLSVGQLVYDNDGAGTIAGLALRFERSGDFPRIDVLDGRLDLDADLEGDSFLRLAGSGTLRLLGDNDIPGTIIVNGLTVEVDQGPQLGALSADWSLNDGTMRALNSLNMSIPLKVTSDSTIDVVSGTFRLLAPLVGTSGSFEEYASKIGPGTFSLEGLGSTSATDWEVLEGDLRLTGDALGSGWLRVHSGGRAVLGGDAVVNRIRLPIGEDPGPIDVGPHTLTLSGDATLRNLAGDGGTIVAGLPGGNPSVGTVTVDGAPDFFGTFRSDTSRLRINPFGAGFQTGCHLSSSSDGRIEILLGPPVVFGSITGQGRLELLGGTTDITTGYGVNENSFEGTLVGGSGTTFRTIGLTYLAGNATNFFGTYVVEEDTLLATDSAAFGSGRLDIRSAGTFRVTPGASVNLNAVVGSGTLSIPEGSTIRLGADSGSDTFTGPVVSEGATGGLVKIGLGTQRLDDLEAFTGPLDVNAGRLEVFGALAGLGGTSATSVAAGATLAMQGALDAPFTLDGTLEALPGSIPIFIRAETKSTGLLQIPNAANVTLTDTTWRQFGDAAITTQGGTLRIEGAAPVLIHGGRLDARTLVLGGDVTFEDVTNEGDVSVPFGGYLALAGETLVNDGTFDTVTGATLDMQVTGPINGTGTILLRGGTLTGAGSATLGPEQTLAGHGTHRSGAVVVTGRFEPADLTIEAPLTLTGTSRTEIDLADGTPAGLGRVRMDGDAAGSIELGGTLAIVAPSAFKPGPGDRIVLFDGRARPGMMTGAFAATELADITPYRFRVEATDDLVELVVGCPADLDEDGLVGTSDLIQVLAAWGVCGGCPADVDGDGAVGIGDLVALLATWGVCG